MFGEWDAALVNQDYEINWLISPQYEGAVSYTHLDVYKRQVVGSSFSILWLDENNVFTFLGMNSLN